MKKGQRIGKWEMNGFFIGCIGIVLSIYMLYNWQYDKQRIECETITFVLGLNIIASIIWLYGIFLNDRKFLLVSIVYWSVPIFLFIMYLIICTILAVWPGTYSWGFNDYFNRKHRTIFGTIAIPLTMCAAIFYIATIVCYAEIVKEIKSKYPPLTIIHPTIPPKRNDDVMNKEDAVHIEDA